MLLLDRLPGIGPIDSATAAFFGAMSKARGKRIFHPEGVSFGGSLTPVGSSMAAGADLFGGDEPLPAQVRLSRALGLPSESGDPCGLAFRVLNAYGPGRHQDFLLVSSARPPIGRHLISPARNFGSRPYSSLLPYSIGGDTRLVGAEVLGDQGRSLQQIRMSADPDLTFSIDLASPTGPWERVAELHIGERLSPAASEQLRFNPGNCGGGIEPIGLLNRLRLPAYGGSQAGRRAGDRG